MPQSAFNKFNSFGEQLARGVHDFDAHTFKIALTNSAPLATNQVFADITQIAASGGYVAGGAASAVTVSRSGGTTTLAGAQTEFEASGDLGPFRYAVLYNDSPSSPAKPLVGWMDYGAAITLAAGEKLRIRFNNADPGAFLTVA